MSRFGKPLLLVTGALLALLVLGGSSFYWFSQSRTPRLDNLPAAQELQVRDAPLNLVAARKRCARSLSTPRCKAAWSKVIPPDSLRWNQLIHALRLWGPGPPGPPGRWTGSRMLDVIQSAERCQQELGGFPHASTRHGLLFVGNPFLSLGEKHRDETLSVLAEVGVESGQAITVYSNRHTVADAIRATAASCTLDQDVEFTTAALAHYLPPCRAWKNKYGQVIGFDRLCDRLCERPAGEGLCEGCHTLYTLALLLAADEQQPTLSAGARQRALATLTAAVRRLETSQLGHGGWGAAWARTAVGAASQSSLDTKVLEVSVTGHSLEWLALTPDEVDYSQEIVARACEFLIGEFLEVSPGVLSEAYNAYSHAANALKLWAPESWESARGSWTTRPAAGAAREAKQ